MQFFIAKNWSLETKIAIINKFDKNKKAFQ
jgi:hypothetical protein